MKKNWLNDEQEKKIWSRKNFNGTLEQTNRNEKETGED